MVEENLSDLGRAIAALEEIRDNPEETPERREKARAALEEERDRNFLLGAYSGTGGGGVARHNRSGSQALRSDAEYDGWGEP